MHMANFDWIRLALLCAMAVVLVMLLQAWDRRERPAEPPGTTGVVPQVRAPATAGSREPEFSSPPSAGAAIRREPGASAPEYLLVQSDLLRLAISPDGGDLVQADLLGYKRQMDSAEPVRLLSDAPARTYMAQSALVGPDGIDNSGRAPLTADRQSFVMGPDDNQLQVDLHHRDGGLHIIKRYRLTRGSHAVQLDYIIDNNTDREWRGALSVQLKRADFDPGGGGLGMGAFVGAALSTPDERYLRRRFDDLEQPFTETVEQGWVAMVQRYFISAWVPGSPGAIHYSVRKDAAGSHLLAGFSQPVITVPPGGGGRLSATLYTGPKDQVVLGELAQHLDLTVDYGWLWFIAQPLFWLMSKIQGLVGNWGLSIIIMTLIIKAAFYQLSAKSYRSMARMRHLQPQMMSIKERYGDDRQKLSQEMMKLYQKERVNPMSGCLPMLVQMPVFLALYWVLLESVELRHAPFFGWIVDLSAKDPWFVLPMLMGASMFVQMRLSPTPPDPTQARIMQIMPVALTVMFIWFPAGLVLYWTVNNILSILQQWFINRSCK